MSRGNGEFDVVAGSWLNNHQTSQAVEFSGPISVAGSTSLQGTTVTSLTNSGNESITGTLSVGSTASITGTASAAAGTSGNQLVNYTQLTNGSFNPRFGLLQRQIHQNNKNWLPNSSFLYGFVGWNNAAGLTEGANNNFTYADYTGTDTSTQYLTSVNLTAASLLVSGSTVNLSGWIFNGTASASATLALNCYNSSNTLLGTIASSSVSIGKGWTYVTNSGTIPSGTTYVQVACGFAGASSGTNITFSQIKLENGSTATPWSDESSTDLFQSSSLFSPTFNGLTLGGSGTIAGTLAVTGTASAAAGTSGNELVNYGQTFQTLTPTASQNITLGNTLKTVVQPGTLTAAITLTLEPGSVVGQEVTIYGSGSSYTVTVSSNVTSGSPFFGYPDESNNYSWVIPSGASLQGIKFTWDGTNWRAQTFGQAVVAPATASNEAVNFGQLIEYTGSFSGHQDISASTVLPSSAWGQQLQAGASGITITLPASNGILGQAIWFYPQFSTGSFTINVTGSVIVIPEAPACSC